MLYNYNYKISREKFEPEPGFEPRTSGFLVLVQIFVLRSYNVNFPRHKLWVCFQICYRKYEAICVLTSMWCVPCRASPRGQACSPCPQGTPGPLRGHTWPAQGRSSLWWGRCCWSPCGTRTAQSASCGVLFHGGRRQWSEAPSSSWSVLAPRGRSKTETARNTCIAPKILNTKSIRNCIVLYWRGGHCCPMHYDLFRSIVFPQI